MARYRRLHLEILPEGRLQEVLVRDSLTVWELKDHLTQYFWEEVYT